MDTKRIKIIGDALMWMEPAPQGQKRGTHRGEFKGWVGEVPSDVADQAIARRQAIEATEEDENTPSAAEATAPSFDQATIHAQSVATITAYLNQLPPEERSAEALRISELELAKALPRQSLVVVLDKIVDSATN